MPTPVKRAFQAIWGRGWAASSVALSYSVRSYLCSFHVSRWGAPVVGRCSSKWSIPLSSRHTSGYGDLQKFSTRRVFPYNDCETVVSRAYSPYGDVPILGVRVSHLFSLMPVVVGRISFPYGNSDRITSRVVFRYSAHTPVSGRVTVEYGDAPVIASRVVTPYGNVPVIPSRNVSWYSIRTSVADRVEGQYGSCKVVTSRLSLGYGDVPAIPGRVICSYAIRTPVATRGILAYSDTPKVISRVITAYAVHSLVACRNKALYGDVPIIASRGVMVYTSRFDVSVRMLAGYSDSVKVKERTTCLYGDVPTISSRQVSVYTVHHSVASRSLSGYGDTPILVSRRSLGYSVHTSVVARGVHRYDEQEPVAIRQSSVWSLLENVATSHLSVYKVDSLYKTRKALVSGYSILSDAIQSIDSSPLAYHEGKEIGILGVTLSCDEASPYWLGSVEIERVEDYGPVSIGDLLQIEFGDETFVLAVDGKSMTRSNGGSGMSMKVEGRSPLSLKDAPFAKTTSVSYSVDTSARTVVESLIGPVDWKLPSWNIPATALVFSEATPLEICRKIVSAIGGLVESNPDGSVICRFRFPVSIPDYETSPVDHVFEDTSILSLNESISSGTGYNRVVVSNGSSSSSVDKDILEQDAILDASGNVVSESKRIRAYLATQRPVELVHTGPPSTVIVPKGYQVRSHTETVEIIEGKGSTSYNVLELKDTVWMDSDLGVLSVSGKTLSSFISGYSLVQVTYTIASVDWVVSSPLIREIQFVLMEA